MPDVLLSGNATLCLLYFLLPKELLSVFLVSGILFQDEKGKDISSGFLHCLLNDSAVHPVVPVSIRNSYHGQNRVGSDCMWLRRCGIHFPIRCLQWGRALENDVSRKKDRLAIDILYRCRRYCKVLHHGEKPGW